MGYEILRSQYSSKKLHINNTTIYIHKHRKKFTENIGIAKKQEQQLWNSVFSNFAEHSKHVNEETDDLRKIEQSMMTTTINM